MKLKLYEDYANNTITKEEYLKRKDELMTEEKQFADEVVSLEMKLKNKADEKIMGVSLSKDSAGFDNLTEDLMKAFVKRIIISPDGSVNIEWNFSDSKAVENLKKAE